MQGCACYDIRVEVRGKLSGLLLSFSHAEVDLLFLSHCVLQASWPAGLTIPLCLPPITLGDAGIADAGPTSVVVFSCGS